MNKIRVVTCARLIVAGFMWSALAQAPVLRAKPVAETAPIQAEVVVYGGTPGGVMAAVAAARHGDTVALVDLNQHVGGVVSGGLCESDVGDPKTLGGFAVEFFGRVLKHYEETYGENSPQVKACNHGWRFEPHVAEKIFNEMIDEQKPRITVYHGYRYQSCTVADGRITSLVVNGVADKKSLTVSGQIFIDASYEGDLMAGAHVPYTYGREGRDQYGEATAGVGIGPDKGKGDKLIMAYNYRLCFCTDPNNSVPAPKPENYDKARWAAIYLPRIQKGKVAHFAEIFEGQTRTPRPNDKSDWNSDDMEGGSAGYPDGDWATRDKIAAAQHDYILGKLYYLQSDPDMTPEWRAEAQKWGLAKDEFTDNGNFPFQLYIREARRMVGAYVLTLNDLTQDRYKPDGICAGSYGTDCHIVRHLTIDGKEQVDHTLHIDLNVYDIPYACLTPKDHPDNLLVPVCISASHVAYCSVRMEPVYMMMGQAAGDAAHLALTNKTSVQQVDVAQLRELLTQEHALLDLGYAPPVKVSFTPEHPKPGETVHFQATPGALKDPIKIFWWDFDGAGAIAAQGAQADHVFTLEKIHHTSLVVEDQAGRRRMVSVDVPVGAAADLDRTVDDLDAAMVENDWMPSNPIIPGSAGRFSDVFIGPSLSYDKVAHGKTSPASGQFQPNLPKAGRYLICFGYRPAARQATNLPITISAGGKETKVTLNETQKDSPFPLVSLGEFRCDAGTGSHLDLNNTGVDGRIAVDAVRWVWLGD